MSQWADSVMKRHAQEFLAGVRIVQKGMAQQPAPKSEQAKTTGASAETTDETEVRESRAVVLSVLALRLLLYASTRPERFLMGHYKELDCGPRKARKVLEELEGRGFARRHALVRSGRGRKPEVLEVTAPGAAHLAGKGLGEPVAWRGRGGFAHAVYCRLLARSQWFEECRVTFETKYGVDPYKVFDVLGRKKNGEVTGGEVICSGGTYHNVKAMKRALEVCGIDALVIASDDQGLLRRVQDRLQVEGRKGSRTEAEVAFVFLGDVVVGATHRESEEVKS